MPRAIAADSGAELTPRWLHVTTNKEPCVGLELCCGAHRGCWVSLPPSLLTEVLLEAGKQLQK